MKTVQRDALQMTGSNFKKKVLVYFSQTLLKK